MDAIHSQIADNLLIPDNGKSTCSKIHSHSSAPPITVSEDTVAPWIVLTPPYTGVTSLGELDFTDAFHCPKNELNMVGEIYHKTSNLGTESALQQNGLI